MWQKNCHMWCWNCTIWGWNRQMWEKSKRTTKFEKIIVTCDVEIAQYEDGTVKYEKKVTWCSRLPTSEYRIPSFFGGYRRITPIILVLAIKKGESTLAIIIQQMRRRRVTLHFAGWLVKGTFHQSEDGMRR